MRSLNMRGKKRDQRVKTQSRNHSSKSYFYNSDSTQNTHPFIPQNKADNFRVIKILIQSYCKRVTQQISICWNIYNDGTKLLDNLLLLFKYRS